MSIEVINPTDVISTSIHQHFLITLSNIPSKGMLWHGQGFTAIEGIKPNDRIFIERKDAENQYFLASRIAKENGYIGKLSLIGIL